MVEKLELLFFTLLIQNKHSTAIWTNYFLPLNVQIYSWMPKHTLAAVAFDVA